MWSLPASSASSRSCLLARSSKQIQEHQLLECPFEKHTMPCMPVYMYVCMYVCMYLFYVWVGECVCIYFPCTYMYIYIYMYVCVCVCVCICVCMHVCMYACMYVCMYACMYVAYITACTDNYAQFALNFSTVVTNKVYVLASAS